MKTGTVMKESSKVQDEDHDGVDGSEEEHGR
jgi:hypothetical protein